MPEPVDSEVISLLREHDGVAVEVELANGRRCAVLNIAWGYDIGDGHAHITTNISPSVDGEPIDFFYTREIVSIRPPDRPTIKVELAEK